MPFPARSAPGRVLSEDPYLRVVEATLDGILVVGAEGRVRYANPAAAVVLGRREDELRRLPIGLPLTGGGGLAQLDVARPDGGNVVLEMHVAPLEWEGEVAHVVTLRDVTARALAERELAASEERFALSARGSNDGLWDWDDESGLVHTSARFQEILDEPPSDLVQPLGALLERVHPDDVDALRAAIARHVSGEPEQLQQELRARRADGSWVWVLAKGMAVHDAGHVRRFAGSLTDITERKAAEEALRRLALHDPLTGLANRALLLDHLRWAIDRFQRVGTPYAVLFLDLDRFKLVNDSLGHSAGDHLLVEVAGRLQRCVRSVDSVARLGGDEFAVLLDSPEDLDAVLRTAERIQAAVAAPLRLDDEVVYTSVSIGVARSEDGAPDPETALRNADIAMYQAKRSGRSSFRVFEPVMHAQGSARLRLHRDLRDAVRQGRLFPRYMPIVDLREGRVVAFEALLRWQRTPTLVLDAVDFIEAAEETDVIVPAGWQLLTQACRQVRDWRAAGYDVLATVNVSHRQLLDDTLADRIAACLAQYDLPGSALGLEISERTATLESQGASGQVEQLRALGVAVYVDDFGTGYSSLAAIHRMPITAMKIDKAFVRALESHAASDDIIAAIVAVARSLRLQVVAEGVETPAQRKRLLELGCELGQGYYFGRAVDAARATALLRSQGRVARVPEPRREAP